MTDRILRISILTIFILTGLVFIVILAILNYIGINIKFEDYEKESIVKLCFMFISLLLAIRICCLYIPYFKKYYGEWTKAGRLRWNYCLIGTIIVVVISALIDSVHMPELITTLIETVIAAFVALYFYGKYRMKTSIENIEIDKQIITKHEN
jgi:hypothetical protein